MTKEQFLSVRFNNGLAFALGVIVVVYIGISRIECNMGRT